jgi:hypothetical protein
LKFFIKLNNLFLSTKYRYFDMFLAFLGYTYCLYCFMVNNEIKYFIILFSTLGLLLGLFDFSRKANMFIQRKMLGLKS